MASSECTVHNLGLQDYVFILVTPAHVPHAPNRTGNNKLFVVRFGTRVK